MGYIPFNTASFIATSCNKLQESKIFSIFSISVTKDIHYGFVC